MRILFPPSEFFERLPHETAMANDADAALRQPRGEIVFVAVVDAVRLERRDFLRGMHRHHRHLGVLPERGRIFGERKIPLHRLSCSIQVSLWPNMERVD